MIENTKEKFLELYPRPSTIECTTKILSQMKNSICKIYKCNGTGFFCNIPYKNSTLKALITNYHVIDDIYISNNKIIKITLNDDKEEKDISLGNRKIYLNKEYDITIIEIKRSDDINANYLELDDKIFKYNSEFYYDRISIYALHYPNKDKASVSYGILKNINNYNINHTCCTLPGSTGSPIINLLNNKVIGIHKEASKYNFNIATFIKYPINEVISNENNNIGIQIENNANNDKNDDDENDNGNILINEFEEVEKKIFEYLKERLNINIIGNEAKLILQKKEINNIDLNLLSKLRFNQLKSLNLSSNKISDIEPIKYFTNIENLNLSSNYIKDIKPIKYLNKLKLLDLTNNKINNILKLREIVPNNKELKRIDLEVNNKNDRSLLGELLGQLKYKFGRNDFIINYHSSLTNLSTVNRIINEFKSLVNEPNNNICRKVFLLNENNIYEWICALNGPKNTPFQDGLFYLKISFPSDYPQRAPEVIFLTPIYHLNINHIKCPGCNLGHVSISTLNFWYSETTIREVLQDIFVFLHFPNPDSPFGIDRQIEYYHDKNLYETKAKYFTQKYAYQKNYKKDLYFDNWDFTYKK